MSDFAIRAERLSKQYYLGQKQEAYRTLRETLVNAFVSPLRKAGKLLHGQATGAGGLDQSFWALKDVSLEIKQGEVVGIIGRNGAGKTTLLKMLSRITEPTQGYVDIRGRVGCLLEVGTGFHPELTGRENVYLNGAILGMKKRELDGKFEEIVTFAGIEKFLDTPVKHYSSGMYVRLAFAVAAHLELEILLVDEVLAVGDARFQKKCLSKMENVGQQGRTVIFVSHNMPALTRLCQRVILLDEGRVVQDGPAHQVVAAYLNSGFGTMAEREWDDPDQAPGNDVVRLRAVRVRTEDGRITDAVDIRQPVGIEMEYEVLRPDLVLVPTFQIFNEEGLHLFTTIDVDPAWHQCPRQTGCYVSTAWVPGNFLAEGPIFVAPIVNTFTPSIVHFREPNAVVFQVVDGLDGNSARGDYSGRMRGVVRPLLKWNTNFKPGSFKPTISATKTERSDQVKLSSSNVTA